VGAVLPVDDGCIQHELVGAEPDFLYHLQHALGEMACSMVAPPVTPARMALAACPDRRSRRSPRPRSGPRADRQASQVAERGHVASRFPRASARDPSTVFTRHTSGGPGVVGRPGGDVVDLTLTSC
jgi:hypothetical protein